MKTSGVILSTSFADKSHDDDPALTTPDSFRMKGIVIEWRITVIKQIGDAHLNCLKDGIVKPREERLNPQKGVLT